jgi:hypothetical protein
MKKRWMATISGIVSKLARPYRPERHYMRGGRTTSGSATRIDPNKVRTAVNLARPTTRRRA